MCEEGEGQAGVGKEKTLVARLSAQEKVNGQPDTEIGNRRQCKHHQRGLKVFLQSRIFNGEIN